MSDIEASELLKKTMSDFNSAFEKLEESEAFKALETRMEEIESQIETNPSDDLKREAEEIEKKADDMLKEQISISILPYVNQNQMIEILLKINTEFIEKNHFPKSEMTSTFEYIIGFFLEKIDDPNHEIHNNLLSNEQFTTAIEYSPYCLNQLIANTNDEKKLFNFLLDYSQNFKTQNGMTDWDDIKDIKNYYFSDIIETIINSQNYSLEFKDYILSNQRLTPYISSYTMYSIIKDSSLPKTKKLELLFRNDVLEKLSNSEFSEALGNFCESYEDYHRALSDEKIFKKINISAILSNTTLKAEELKKLLLDDKVYDQMNTFDLSNILKHGVMDFETRKSILFDEKLFSKLIGSTIANIITCKYLTIDQRFELINDERIFKAIVGKDPKIHIDFILDSFYVPIMDKVALVKDERFMKYVSDSVLERIISNPDLPIETATEFLFDKKIFYRLIGEWNEEYNHPDDFYGNKGPYKYDKYEYVQKLYEKNPYIARTLSYKLLKDDILDLGFNFIEKISKYKQVSESLASAFSDDVSQEYLLNMIKTVENSRYAESMDTTSFVTRLIEISHDNSYYGKDPKKVRKLSKIRYTANLDTSKFTEENWKTITEIGLRDKSIYCNEIQDFRKDEIDISLNILPDIETMDDLNNYEARRISLCDEYFKKAIEQRNLDEVKNAYLNKYFIEKPEYVMQTKYVEQLQKIINIQKIDTISDIYNNSRIEPLSFDDIVFIDQSIRQMYSKQLSDNMYKITDKVLNESGEYVQNIPKDMEFMIEIDGVKTPKKVSVYEPGYDFKMLIHSTAAYGQMQLINDNYFDSWNKSSRTSNHGICCSMIANDNMGMAAVNDVLLGFDSWDPRAITKSSPYDIYSHNDSYDIEEGRPLTFMSAQDIINNTRHTHNEQVLERYELRAEKRTPECQNIQPSYVIIYSDMSDEIKQKAIKCSVELNIPIVYLDKEKIVQHEVSKIDKKISDLENCTTLDKKLDILEQILLSHENNRSGLKATNNEWMERYFPTSKIEALFEKAISEIQTNYQETGNIIDYFNNSSKLMDILEKENKKFDLAMEAVQRKNYIDIPVETYETRLMQCINPNLCRSDKPKLESIIQTSLLETPDLQLSQALSSVDSALLHKQIDDAVKKGLYPNNGKNHNIGHIERVICLSQLIGREELKLETGGIDEHAMNLLLECAKYHDCGRENDYVDKKHGQKSASKMMEFLKQDGFNEEDIKIMQAAVVYHEAVDDDFRFERICEEYGIASEKIDYTKKIANCLKDADSLDRTRFLNPNSKLHTKKLRVEASKSLIPIAESLNRSYEEFDRQQFIKNCQYLYQQSLLQTKTTKGILSEQPELVSQERKK